jgi:hypothetical protein
MEHLTESLGIVKPNVSPAPMQGFKVVVFKEKKGGNTFFKTIDDENGKALKNNIFTANSYIAHAVNSYPHLSFEKSTEIVLPEQHNHFTLACRIYFQVAEPKLLAVWFKNDPIRIIWEEIKCQFGINIKKSNITIDDVRRRFKKIEDTVLTGESWNSIREIANEYGINIKRVLLNPSLPESALELDIAKDKHSKEMELDKLKLEKGESERFEKRQAKKHEIELKNMEKNSKFEGDVREHASVAVGNLVEQINDPESFKQSAAVIMEVTKKIFPPPVQENDPDFDTLRAQTPIKPQLLNFLGHYTFYA